MTEQVTGIDLVEAQFHLAAAQPLSAIGLGDQSAVGARLSIAYDIGGSGRSSIGLFYGEYHDAFRDNAGDFAGSLTGAVTEQQVWVEALGEWVTTFVRGGTKVRDAFFAPRIATPVTEELQPVQAGSRQQHDVRGQPHRSGDDGYRRGFRLPLLRPCRLHESRRRPRRPDLLPRAKVLRVLEPRGHPDQPELPDWHAAGSLPGVAWGGARLARALQRQLAAPRLVQLRRG